MNQYLLIYRNDVSQEFNHSPEQMQAIMEQWGAWHEDLAKEGRLVASEALQTSGKVLAPDNSITDGPYVESKELIGGFTLIKAESIEKAIDLAKGCPLHAGGEKIEVREVMKFEL